MRRCRYHAAGGREHHGIFPRAFAISGEQPLQFDFNIFLLDFLTLPQHREARESEEPTPPQAVVFTNLAGAIAYSTE